MVYNNTIYSIISYAAIENDGIPVMLAYMNMKSSYSRANVYAFKLDGDKISKIDVEKTKANLTQGYSRYLGDKLDKDLIEVIAFDDVINRNLTLKIAENLI